MRMEQLDVFFLLDTRTPLRMGKFLGRQARDFLGPGSVAHVSPARPALESGATDRHALVGGQLLLLAPSWGWHLSPHAPTPPGWVYSPRQSSAAQEVTFFYWASTFRVPRTQDLVLRSPAINYGTNSNNGYTATRSLTTPRSTLRT